MHADGLETTQQHKQGQDLSTIPEPVPGELWYGKVVHLHFGVLELSTTSPSESELCYHRTNNTRQTLDGIAGRLEQEELRQEKGDRYIDQICAMIREGFP